MTEAPEQLDTMDPMTSPTTPVEGLTEDTWYVDGDLLYTLQFDPPRTWRNRLMVRVSYTGYEAAKVEADRLRSDLYAFLSARRTPAPASGELREQVARMILGPKSHWNYEGMRSRPLTDWPQYPEVVRALAKAAQIIPLVLSSVAITQGESLQARVQPWMMACFGPEIAADRLERNDRFIEEALELVQASGYDKSRAHELVEYVYGRPQGEINQEVGGVMITLAAHCLAHGADMHDAGETELARIWTKVEQIREKQKAKPKGSALPIPPAVGDR